MAGAKPFGFSFEIGKDDKGWFWYLGELKLLKVRPSRNGIDAKYGGFKFDILYGTARRPIPKWYKFWRFLDSRDYVKHETEFNPWNSGNHWYIQTMKKYVGMFLSISFGHGKRQPGFYIGTKTYEVNRISQNLKIYKPDRNDIITDDIAWGDKSEKGNIYLCPSGSIRDDLVD